MCYLCTAIPKLSNIFAKNLKNLPDKISISFAKQTFQRNESSAVS